MTAATPAPEQHAAREERATGVLGLIMVVAAVVVLVDAARLRGSDDAVGPAAAPTLVGVLLGLVGGALAIRSRRSLPGRRGVRRPHDDGPDTDGDVPGGDGPGGDGPGGDVPGGDAEVASPVEEAGTGGRLWRLAALVATLIAFALLLPVMGYVVCSAGLFVSAALLLGAPHPARVVAYGWTLAIVVFLIFDVVIGLSLPTGPWGF